MRLAIIGATGKMGQAVRRVAGEHADVQVTAELDRAQGTAGGSEAAIAAGLQASEVYIDFSTPAGTLATAQAALALAEHGPCVAAVVGTTGLGEAEHAALHALAAKAPVLLAANFSLGVNLLRGFAHKLGQTLDASWDAEVVEVHHRLKRDAPSGTALALAQDIARGRQVSYDAVKCHARDGEIGPRPPGEIGVATVRGGDVVGEHTVTFYGLGERLAIEHRATSRDIFARGALHAAKWLVGKPPGAYDMLDVLGLR